MTPPQPRVFLIRPRAPPPAALADPASASTLAAREGLSRQRVNYHLRALERHGLLELVEERRRGNCTERVMQAPAASYVISPAALSPLQPDPTRAPNPLSAASMLAVGARLVRELGELTAGALRAGKPLATFTIDSEITFASAADRAAFADDLAGAVSSLAARYHTERPAAGAVIGWWWPSYPA